jgi:hypothetical protein
MRADMEDPALNESIDRNIKLARALGVTGTPTFIMGRPAGRLQAAGEDAERHRRRALCTNNSGAQRRLSASHRGQRAFATPHQHFSYRSMSPDPVDEAIDPIKQDPDEPIGHNQPDARHASRRIEVSCWLWAAC